VAENNIEISLISRAQTLLIKDYANFDIVDYDYEVFGEDVLLNSPGEIIDRAREERYEIRIAEENRNIAEKDVQLASGAYWPTVNPVLNSRPRYADHARFRRGFIDPLDDHESTSHVLQVDIPVLNGWAVRNPVTRSQINVLRADYQLEQAELALESNV